MELGKDCGAVGEDVLGVGEAQDWECELVLARHVFQEQAYVPLLDERVQQEVGGR